MLNFRKITFFFRFRSILARTICNTFVCRDAVETSPFVTKSVSLHTIVLSNVAVRARVASRFPRLRLRLKSYRTARKRRARIFFARMFLCSPLVMLSIAEFSSLSHTFLRCYHLYLHMFIVCHALISLVYNRCNYATVIHLLP